MLLKIKWAITLLLVTANLAFPQSGTLDPSFGLNGESKVTFDRTKYADDYGGQVQIDKGGKILVFGCNTDSIDAYYSFIRLDKDGKLDNSFNGTGKLLVKANTSLENAGAVKFLLDSADNFILAGKLDSNNYSIVKYTEVGMPDSSFGLNGKICLNGYVDNINMKQDNLNRIVLAGYIPSDSMILIKRFLGNGNIDSTLCKDGELIISKDFKEWVPEGEWNSNNFCIDNKNRILVGKDSTFEDGGPFKNLIFISRYNCDGMIDSTFSDNGIFFKDMTPWGYRYPGSLRGLIADKSNNVIYTYNLGSDYDNIEVATKLNEDGTYDRGLTGWMGWISNIVFDNDGRIIFTGARVYDQYYSTYHNIMRCYNEDGSRDSTFGINGELDLGLYNCISPMENYTYRSTVLDENDKILLAGTSVNFLNLDFIIKRFTHKGVLDKTFNKCGQVYVNGDDSIALSFHGNHQGREILRDNNGRLIITGNIWYSSSPYHNSDFGIFRLKESGEIDTSYNSIGKLSLSGAIYNSSVDLQDNCLLMGMVYSISDYEIKLLKILENGQIDTSFGSNGKAIFSDVINFLSIIDIELDTLGRIILIGNYGNIVRLNRNGLPDSTFNSKGVVVIPNAQLNNCFIHKSDGKLILTGTKNNSSLVMVYILNDNGSIDTLIQLKDTLSSPKFYLDDNNRLLISAQKMQGGSYQSIIARYNLDGNFDSSFGIGGVIYTKSIESGSYEIHTVQNNPERFFLLNSKNVITCLQSNGNIDTTFAMKGKCEIENTICQTLFADSNFIWVAGTDIYKNGFKVSKFYARNNQSIDFSLPDTLELGTPPFRLVALVTSGLDVYYSSSDQAIADIKNDSLFVAEEGVVTITAHQPGNSSFYAAEPLSKNLFVKEAHISPISINEEEAFKAYPNPVSTTLFLESNSYIESIIIKDIEGKELYKKTGITESEYQIEMSAFNPGCYFLTVQYSRTKPPVVRKVFKL